MQLKQKQSHILSLNHVLDFYTITNVLQTCIIYLQRTKNILLLKYLFFLYIIQKALKDRNNEISFFKNKKNNYIIAKNMAWFKLNRVD